MGQWLVKGESHFDMGLRIDDMLSCFVIAVYHDRDGRLREPAGFVWVPRGLGSYGSLPSLVWVRPGDWAPTGLCGFRWGCPVAIRALRLSIMCMCEQHFDQVLEVVQTVFEYGTDDRDAELLVVMYGNVSETDHRLHPSAKFIVHNIRLLQHDECFAALLRYAKPVLTHQAHGRVDGCLTGALKIEKNGVLLFQIGLEFGFTTRIELVEPVEASLNGGSFVDQNIIHGCFLARRCLP